MKHTIKALMVLAIICCLFLDVAKTQYVKLDTLSDYYWNWVLWYISYSKTFLCTLMGSWGVFFLNDNGKLAENCLRTGRPGGRVTYSGYPLDKDKIYPIDPVDDSEMKL